VNKCLIHVQRSFGFWPLHVGVIVAVFVVTLANSISCVQDDLLGPLIHSQSDLYDHIFVMLFAQCRKHAFAI
jgi:hypothetical protein